MGLVLDPVSALLLDCVALAKLFNLSVLQCSHLRKEILTPAIINEYCICSKCLSQWLAHSRHLINILSSLLFKHKTFTSFKSTKTVETICEILQLYLTIANIRA